MTIRELIVKLEGLATWGHDIEVVVPYPHCCSTPEYASISEVRVEDGRFVLDAGEAVES